MLFVICIVLVFAIRGLCETFNNGEPVQEIVAMSVIGASLAAFCYLVNYMHWISP